MILIDINFIYLTETTPTEETHIPHRLATPLQAGIEALQPVRPRRKRKLAVDFNIVLTGGAMRKNFDNVDSLKRRKICHIPQPQSLRELFTSPATSVAREAPFRHLWEANAKVPFADEAHWMLDVSTATHTSPIPSILEVCYIMLYSSKTEQQGPDKGVRLRASELNSAAVRLDGVYVLEGPDKVVCLRGVSVLEGPDTSVCLREVSVLEGPDTGVCLREVFVLEGPDTGVCLREVSVLEGPDTSVCLREVSILEGPDTGVCLREVSVLEGPDTGVCLREVSVLEGPDTGVCLREELSSGLDESPSIEVLRAASHASMDFEQSAGMDTTPEVSTLGKSLYSLPVKNQQ
ncbi:hypothetical protein QZH41_016755, partial [Actinostola sp. cb2023]